MTTPGAVERLTTFLARYDAYPGERSDGKVTIDEADLRALLAALQPAEVRPSPAILAAAHEVQRCAEIEGGAMETADAGVALAALVLAEVRHDEPRWRKEPPTVEEVSACEWWWNSGGPSGKPHVMRLDVDGDQIVDIQLPSEVPFNPEDWPGEWSPCLPPRDEPAAEVRGVVASVNVDHIPDEITIRCEEPLPGGARWWAGRVVRIVPGGGQ